MSRVKFPQSVMIWGEMSSAGVAPLCFLKTNITAPVYQEILEHFMLPSADQLFKDADFIFQQDLAPAHVTTPPGSTPPQLVLASSGSRTQDSGAGGGRSNKERQRLQPLASVARAPLFEVRRVRFIHSPYWHKSVTPTPPKAPKAG